MNALSPMTRILPAHRRRAADYRAVFSGPAGERVLADLFDFCGVARECSHLDAEGLNRQEGMRRVALRVASFLNLKDEEIVRRAMSASPFAEHPEDGDET
jgi:hypothetical protein